MVELHGAAILAAEVEHLAQALVNEQDINIDVALEALMAGLLQLSAYIHRLSTTRQDQPAKLLPTLNELRMARGEEALSEAAVFNPDVDVATTTGAIEKPAIARDEFNELIRKLRQNYQKAMVSIVRDQDLAESYAVFSKICSRLHKVAGNTLSEPLWKISFAIMQSLEHESQAASVTTKQVLRQIDTEIKRLQESGRDALEQRPAPALLKSLLYTVAKAKPVTELIQSIQNEYRLRDALPALDASEDKNIALPDSDAIRSVIKALGEELAEIHDVLDLHARGEAGEEYDLGSVTAIFQRVTNTLSVLGAVDALEIVKEQQLRVEDILANGTDDKENAFVEIAAQLVAVQDALSLSESINDARAMNIATHQIDQAHSTVIREARTGLEQAKEAIVEFVASQWNREPLQNVPSLLAEVHGGLVMVPLERGAAVIKSCKQYVSEQLLVDDNVPEWQLLDTLADAISSVEYYLECLAGDSQAELDSILDVAQESVAALGYPLEITAVEHHANELASGDTVGVTGSVTTNVTDSSSREESDMSSENQSNQDGDRSTAEVIDLHAHQKDRQDAPEEAEAPAEQATAGESEAVDDSEEDIVDEEIIEIFVEEAAEVLETINEYLPKWKANRDDDDSRTEIRRAFHTLKGSGRMVGAADVGELAWSVENMLNRVLEGTHTMTDARMDIVTRVYQIVPEMVEGFEKRVKVDTSHALFLMGFADQLAKGEELDAIPEFSAEAAVEEPAAEEPVAEAPVEEVTAEEAAPEETVTEEASYESAAAQFENEISSDAALLEIFVAEANSHLEIVQAYVSASKGQDDVELSEDLQRALHTLKGSAHMAEITRIAEVVSPIERLVKELRGCHVNADAAVIDSIAKGYDLITLGLGQLVTDPHGEIEGAQAYIDSVQEIHHERLANFANKDDEESAAVDKAALMLIDGMEKLLHAADLISGWSAKPEDTAGVTDLISDLRNVEEVAQQADYSPIAEISHALANLYQRALEENPVLDKAFFAVAEKGHEALIDMMDIIAAGQGVSPNAELLAELQNAPENFQVAAPEAEEAPAEETAATEETPSFELAEADADKAEAASAEDAVQDAETAAAIASIVENIDEETLEIFIEEAGDLIEEIDGAVNEWLSDRNDLSHREDLMRTLHTLKGGARLAGITPLGDLSHAYETYLEQSTDLNEAFFGELANYQDRLHGMVEAVLSGEYEKLVTLGGDAMQLLELPVFETSKTEQIVSIDEDYDPEVIEIFFEEARDLQEAIDNRIHRWMDDRGDLSHLEELKRLLHTLKGGARLAGMRALGNLSHNFETLLINSERQNEVSGDEFFATIHNFQDQLSATLEEIDRVVKEAENSAAQQAKADATPASPEPQDEPSSSDSSNVVSIVESGTQLPDQPKIDVPLAAVEAARTFIDNFEKDQDKARGPQEVVKVPAQLLEDLVNLAGETSTSRGRVEQQISEAAGAIDEMEGTIDRLKGQLRRLEIETEAQIIFRQEQVESEGAEGFDPLEMDRYSHMQQLARSLIESASDLQDVKETFHNKIRDMETLLLQQSRINTELQEGLMRSQMVPFSRMVPRLRRIVRQVSSELGKHVDLQLENVEGELDRTVLERMVAPLEHMLRNAVDHGIEEKDARVAAGKSEQGSITLGLRREGGEVVLDLSDDGGGINLEAVKEKATERGLMDKSANLTDHEILQFILHAGFSTATTVTQISGRGVGMDVVHSEIKQLGGSMDINSTPGQGSTFTVRLPFTVSVNRALMVVIDNDTYAIPLNTIEGIVRVSPYELEAYYQPDAPPFEYAGQSYNLRYMGSLLHTGARPKLEGQTMPLPVILVRGSEHTVAVQVDKLLGSREIVVKTMGPQFSMVEGLSGATVMGDGSVVVILDLLALIRADFSRGPQFALAQEEEKAVRAVDRNLLVMVVDDSVTVRKVTSRFLERQGMDVLLAKDGVDAVQKLAEIEQLPDVMLLDIEMPRMDGFEVASRVKHSDRLKQIPIIMITSRTGEKHRDRAFSLGVNKYMGKPYQEVELLNTIKDLTGVENF